MFEKRRHLNAVLVAHDVPYPPVHGGRLDMWNRIVALSRQGVRIRLVTWTDGEVTEEHLKRMREYVEHVSVHQRNLSPWIALHPYYPTTIISRSLPREAYEAELRDAKAASPDLVFLDGLFGTILARSLARDLNIPLVYRSHNVEYEYMRALMPGETRLIKKMVLFANILRTKIVEQRVRNDSSLVYDISEEDRATWGKPAGTSGNRVLSYYLHPDRAYPPVGANLQPDIDVLYVGNLHSVNNAFGLEWFAKKVAPELMDLRIVAAGARPSPELRDLLEGAGVDVLADPYEVGSLYERARLLINPVWHGSGVNIKMVEMLSTGKPVVSTLAGKRGLSSRLLDHVSVADDPTEFANKVRGRLGVAPSLDQRASVEEEHHWKNVVSLIDDLQQVCSEVG